MNTHQRGAYQPAMDNAQIYDLADEDIEEEEHSRLPLLIVIALLVLAAFAGARGPRPAPRRGPADASRSTRRSAFHRATWSNVVGIEVGVQLAVEDVQHVLVERGGDAGGVVVRADEPAPRPSPGRCRAAASRRGAGSRPARRGTAPGARARSSRSSRRGTRPCGAPSSGTCARWRSKSPTTAWTSTPGYSAATWAAASRSVASDTSNGANVRRRSARWNASSRMRVFSDVPEPSSTRVSAPLGGDDVVGVREQDRALGAGRVVLGQPRDLVEQLRAAVVVEPLGREVLRGRGEAAAGVGAQCRAEVGGIEVRVDLQRRGVGHRAFLPAG